MSDRENDFSSPDLGDDIGQEGGKTAPGEAAGSRSLFDGASGGYGSESGRESSGGTGDGDATAGDVGSEPGMDDGSTTGSGAGASGAGPTEWLRQESSNPQD